MLTTQDLLDALGISLAGPSEQAWAQQCANAVNDYVDALPHVTPGAWTPRTHTGASLLAQRIYAGRSAPLGAAGYDVTGSLIRATTDPEVGRMLRVGRYAIPRVG